jgi:D-psicose/D-tagatose/L-ribulose 3-epimerase
VAGDWGLPLRLAVSNLAWPPGEDAEALGILAGLDVQGVEVAPARMRCPPAEYRNRVADAGLDVCALQGIMFGRPELQLFGEMWPLKDHFERMGDIAREIGAGVMVFGAPSNRRRRDISLDDAWIRAAGVFGILADATQGVIIGLEPIPRSYGCDFLTDWFSVWAMVRAVNHPNLRVHLDTACVTLAGGSVGEAVRDSKPVHFHASQPAMEAFGTPLPEHQEAATALHAINYQGWVTIEMLEQTDWREAIRCAVGVVGPMLGAT